MKYATPRITGGAMKYATPLIADGAMKYATPLVQLRRISLVYRCITDVSLVTHMCITGVSHVHHWCIACASLAKLFITFTSCWGVFDSLHRVYMPWTHLHRIKRRNPRIALTNAEAKRCPRNRLTYRLDWNKVKWNKGANDDVMSVFHMLGP